jgi:phosphogluconate dehydratase
MHPIIQDVTNRIQERSAPYRAQYLSRLATYKTIAPRRSHVSCSNLAHGAAACCPGDKDSLYNTEAPNIAIVTAYNDMLSAHQPYKDYPDILKKAARNQGMTAMVAGGVPAMCDGITQGRAGMDLSLFSRDTIAMSTGIALSHQLFDGGLCLGICDKIVPGLLMGSLSFGHLPFVFVPAGPMSSGLPNKDKIAVREAYAAGEIDKQTLQAAEAASYHGPGTCTFYGTANSNQMFMEFMGLHLPGASFVHPHSPLRQALNESALAAMKNLVDTGKGMGFMLEAASWVNGMVGLLATGGSTNHTIHLVAMARAAGYVISWRDFHELSQIVPLLVRVYPNGDKDINGFHEAGGTSLIVQQLLEAGLLQNDVETIVGHGLNAYTNRPNLDLKPGTNPCKLPHISGLVNKHRDTPLSWAKGLGQSSDETVIRPMDNPFLPDSGLKMVKSLLGRGVMKTSAILPAHQVVSAPAKIFNCPREFKAAFDNGDLHKDFIAVVRHQGPAANGMPELHELIPILSVLQNLGYKVGLVTDGRLSGASGKVPAVMHMCPEAQKGGLLGAVENGDVLTINGEKGTLECEVESHTLVRRLLHCPLTKPDITYGAGRELFQMARQSVTQAHKGAFFLSHLFFDETDDKTND